MASASGRCLVKCELIAADFAKGEGGAGGGRQGPKFSRATLRTSPTFPRLCLGFADFADFSGSADFAGFADFADFDFANWIVVFRLPSRLRTLRHTSDWCMLLLH